MVRTSGLSAWLYVRHRRINSWGCDQNTQVNWLIFPSFLCWRACETFMWDGQCTVIALGEIISMNLFNKNVDIVFLSIWQMFLPNKFSFCHMLIQIWERTTGGKHLYCNGIGARSTELKLEMSRRGYYIARCNKEQDEVSANITGLETFF